jgi:hypothetical protein
MLIGRVSKSPLDVPFLFTRIAPIVERLERIDDEEASNATVLLREIELDLVAAAFPTQSERDQAREAFIASLFDPEGDGSDWFNRHCLSLFNDLDRLLPRVPQPGLDAPSTTANQELAVRGLSRNH